MAKNDPTYYIQYHRPKSGASTLRRYLVSKSDWVTVGAETDANDEAAKKRAIDKAKDYPDNIRVRVVKASGTRRRV